MATLRTTVRLNDSLIQQAKIFAAKTNRTFTALLEEGLRLVLEQTKKKSSPKKQIKLACYGRSGVQPGINLDKTSELLELLDEEKDRKLYDFGRRQHSHLRPPKRVARS